MTIQASLLYAGLLGLLLVVMAFNVLHHWVRTSATEAGSDQAMRRAKHVMASFVEYVPLTLILLLMLDLRGAPPLAVHLLGSCLLLSRVLHAFGSNFTPGSGVLRFVGVQLTFLTVAVASLACLYLYCLTGR